MSEITFPITFEELAITENQNGFELSDPNVVADMRSEAITDQIEDLINAGIEINCDNRAESTINFIFSAIHHFSNLPVENQCVFVDYMIDISKQIIEVLPTITSTTVITNYKKVLFLFQYLCIKLEQSFKSTSSNTVVTTSSTSTSIKSKKKNTSKDTFNWLDWRYLFLEVLDLLVSPQLTSSWSMGIVQENFLSHIWNYVLKLLIDRPIGISGTSNKEIQTRNLCIHIIIHSISHFGNPQSSSSYETFSTALLESIIQVEHMSTSIAPEICFQIRNLTTTNPSTSYGNVIISEVITVISRMNLAQIPANSICNVSCFIESFAKVAPSSISESFPTLLKQLDSPARQMRSAIISACGSIIIHIHETIIAQTTTSTLDVVVAATSEDADLETNTKNINSIMRFRDSLLDILIERTHDTNPYTRTTVLKVWSRLFESSALPIKRAGTAAEIALDRLFDKNSITRRNAIALMTACIENNPFSGTLDTSLFQIQKLEVEKLYKIRVSELKVSLGNINSTTNYINATKESHVRASRKGLKNLKELSEVLEQVAEEDEEEDNDDEDNHNDREHSSEGKEEADDRSFEKSIEVQEDEVIVEYKNKLVYIQSVQSFVISIESALSKIGSMLQSKTTGDVIEALRFFTRAINFKVNGSLDFFKKSFSLVWHQDFSIKNELIAAFHNVYLTDGATEQSQFLSSIEIVSNLIHLVQHCDQAELTSMEKIIGEMFSAGQVEDAVIEVLWDKLANFSRNNQSNILLVKSNESNTHMSELSACLSIISMIARSVPKIMDEIHMKLVIQVSLNERNLQVYDFVAMKAGIQCIQTIPSLLKQCITSSERDIYLNSSMHKILLDSSTMFATIILGSFCSEDEVLARSWFGLCEEAVHGLFHFHPSPDKVMSILIQNMYSQLNNTCTTTTSTSSNVCRMARLLFVLGQTSLNSLVYTEAIAAIAKKYPTKDQLQAIVHNQASRNMIASKNTKASRNSNATTTSGGFSTTFAENEGAVDAMEEEMGAAAAADADHERMLNHIIEQELVIKNLLGKFLPLLSYLVANEQHKFNHQLLRETSILAMCRYMSTSSTLCESLLPLLFTILEREPSVEVRTTVIISLGDLAFRFPNSIEPWTNRMYSRLSDENVIVRYNALMVITHLVLNDMIKVKGQVSHVANSLNDSNESIRELAKLFFIKLSERSNNPVYNLLGDMISIFSNDQLDPITTSTIYTNSSITSNDVVVFSQDNDSSSSMTSSNVKVLKLSKEQFQTTMHFLLSFVQKDKQADALLERLLTRMSLSNSVSQRRNLAFCISELTVTEKGIKKMIELIKIIKDALYDNEVYEYFKITLNHCKKSSRNTTNSTAMSAETKTAIEEFEVLLAHIHAQANGIEDAIDSVVVLGDTTNDLVINGDVVDELNDQVVINTTIAAKPVPSIRSKTQSKGKKVLSNKTKSKKQCMDSSDDDDDNDSLTEDNSDNNQSDNENNNNKSNLNINNIRKNKNKIIKNNHTTSNQMKSKRLQVIRNDDDDDEFM